MRVYHFLPSLWALDDIEHRRIKLSRISDLNDPFELISIAGESREFRSAASRWKATMSARYGILCFSGKPSNPVQWTHYADRHRGICLGFDVSDDVLIPVNYVSRRLIPDTLRHMLKGAGDSEARMVMRRVLATKYAHWRYEAEVRAFYRLEKEDGGHYFADFDEALTLREVLVGPNSEVSRVEVTDRIGALEGVQVSKMRLAFKTFSVVKNKAVASW